MKRRVLPFNGSQFARLSSLNPHTCRLNLEDYLKGGGFINYWYTREAILSLISGIPGRTVLAGCERLKSKDPNAKRHTLYDVNREVLLLAIDLVKPVSSTVHIIEQRPMPVLADQFLWVKPPGMIVRDGKPTIFWCQPLRHFCQTMEAYSIYNSLLVDRWLKAGDYDEMDTECYDFQVDKDTNVRRAKLIRLIDAPAISKEELDERLEIFAKTFNQLIAEGILKKTPIKKPPAPAVRGLFD
jgi:hypothetical protein